MIPVETLNDLLTDYKNKLYQAGFTRTDPASGIMVVSAPILDHLADLNDRMASIEESQSFSVAIGADLDRIGARYGLSRLQASPSYSYNFRFYVYNGSTYGTAKSVGMPLPAVIPAGTWVFNPNDPSVKYRTVNEAVFNTDTIEQFVTVVSAQIGSGSRVAANTLVAHNVAAVANVIWCSNPNNIDTGDDRESDTDFRYRISQRVESLGGSTLSGLQSVVVAVPGVRDAQVTTNSRGPGTVSISVLSATSPCSSELLARVSSEAYQYVAAGIVVDVSAPKEIPVAVRLAVSPDSEALRQSVRAAIAQLFGDLTTNQELMINDMIAAAINVGADDVSVVTLSIDGIDSPIYNTLPPNGTRFYLSEVEAEAL